MAPSYPHQVEILSLLHEKLAAGDHAEVTSTVKYLCAVGTPESLAVVSLFVAEAKGALSEVEYAVCKDAMFFATTDQSLYTAAQFADAIQMLHRVARHVGT